jgi:hypothetical protein
MPTNKERITKLEGQMANCIENTNRILDTQDKFTKRFTEGTEKFEALTETMTSLDRHLAISNERWVVVGYVAKGVWVVIGGTLVAGVNYLVGRFS